MVPQEVTAAIAERSSLFLISMGGGAAGHAQYLLTEDVLGATAGHRPRHAKVYADFRSELAALQEKRVAAMRAFADEVHEGAYPTPETVVSAAPEVVAEFRAWLDGQA